MKIVACIKEVPDTATVIKIGPDGKDIVRDGIEFIVNPYDEFAVEEALRIKEKFGEGEVVVVSLGPERATEAIRKCLAMGADRAVHLCDKAFDGSDTYATALALALAIQKEGFDLILCGKQAVDGDEAQVGASIAEILGIPQVSLVIKLEISPDKKTAIAQRQVEGATEIIECKLPALFTAQKGLNEPRYPSLKGIMGAKKKPLTVLKSADLGLDAGCVGPAGSFTAIQKLSLPPVRPAGKVLEGEQDQVVQELVRALKEDDKVL